MYRSGTAPTCQNALPSSSLLPSNLSSPLPAHTCSLGTKWMLQSHLIGLHFRIQGHLESLFNNISCSTKLFMAVLGRKYFFCKRLSCSHWTSDSLQCWPWRSFALSDCSWGVVAFLFSFCVFLAMGKCYKTVSDIRVIFVILEQLSYVLATSSVPFFSLACLFLLPLLWLSQR